MRIRLYGLLLQKGTNMLQKRKYDDFLTNERYMKFFSSQFAFADTAMKEAVDLIKTGKAEDEGLINVAVEVLKNIAREKVA